MKQQSSLYSSSVKAGRRVSSLRRLGLERCRFGICHCRMKPSLRASGWLSGAYYVTLPEVIHAPDGHRAGWIDFGESYRDIAHSAHPELKAIQPEEGILLMFPSYFYHRTLPSLPAGSGSASPLSRAGAMTAQLLSRRLNSSQKKLPMTGSVIARRMVAREKIIGTCDW
jgi:Putative 2OG-Fe(II) oxygenase